MNTAVSREVTTCRLILSDVSEEAPGIVIRVQAAGVSETYLLNNTSHAT
jgi:hypothetical protein